MRCTPAVIAVALLGGLAGCASPDVPIGSRPIPVGVSDETLRFEVTWRLREWAAPLSWQVRPEGVVLCDEYDPECAVPLTTPTRELDVLQAEIDATAIAWWRTFCDSIEGMECDDAGQVVTHAAYPRRFYGGLRNDVPEVLLRDDGAEIRDIDRLFWALTEFEALWMTDDDPPVSVTDPEAVERELDWLAARYGLTREGPLVLSNDGEQGGEALPVGPDDLVYGVFVRSNGERWVCARDAPPGKYCCYAYCDQIGGDGRLAEGH